MLGPRLRLNFGPPSPTHDCPPRVIDMNRAYTSSEFDGTLQATRQVRQVRQGKASGRYLIPATDLNVLVPPPCEFN